MIAVCALAIRLALGGVLLVALVGKLRDVPAFTRSLDGFGVHPRRRRSVVRSVLAAEATTTVLLLVPPTAAVGTVVATALFGALTVLVARVVGAGHTVSCRCFGTRSGRLSPAQVWRNGLLTTLALGGLALSIGGADAERPSMVGGVAAGGIAVGLVAFVFAVEVLVARAIDRRQAASEPVAPPWTPKRGDHVPLTVLVPIDRGAPIHVPDAHGRTTLLALLSADAPARIQDAPDFAAMADAVADLDTQAAAIIVGGWKDPSSLVEQLAGVPAVMTESGADGLAAQLGVHGLPWYLAVDPEGTVVASAASVPGLAGALRLGELHPAAPLPA